MAKYHLRTPNAPASEAQIAMLKKLKYNGQWLLTMQEASDEIDRLTTKGSNAVGEQPAEKPAEKPADMKDIRAAFEHEKAQKRRDIFASVALQQAVAFWAGRQGVPKDIDETTTFFYNLLTEISAK